MWKPQKLSRQNNVPFCLACSLSKRVQTSTQRPTAYLLCVQARRDISKEEVKKFLELLPPAVRRLSGLPLPKKYLKQKAHGWSDHVAKRKEGLNLIGLPRCCWRIRRRPLQGGQTSQVWRGTQGSSCGQVPLHLLVRLVWQLNRCCLVTAESRVWPKPCCLVSRVRFGQTVFRHKGDLPEKTCSMFFFVFGYLNSKPYRQYVRWRVATEDTKNCAMHVIRKKEVFPRGRESKGCQRERIEIQSQRIFFLPLPVKWGLLDFMSVFFSSFFSSFLLLRQICVVPFVRAQCWTLTQSFDPQVGPDFVCVTPVPSCRHAPD